MKNQTFAYVCGVLAAIALASQAVFADPAEVTTLTLKRASTDAQVSGQLSKNQYHQEATQVHYTESQPYQTTEQVAVQVPYQDTETEAVQVPYTEQEAYTDYETQYTSEQQCHQESQQQCAYETECHPESQNVCNNVSNPPNCHMVQECGTNALGEQICKDRQVCDGGGSHQECHTESQNVCHQAYRCNDVPHQVCNYVQVPHQVAVTKYREVTKYRTEYQTHTVTKYRTEYQTQTVTHYHDVDMCCHTEYNTVFDGQKTVNVVVQLPPEAVLAAGEVEQFKITLVSADTAQVKLDFVNTLYGYKIVNQQVAGANVTIQLALAPKYTAADVGDSTIQNISLIGAAGSLAVAFQDQGIRKHMNTQYLLRILDSAGAAVVEKSLVSDGSAQVKIPVEGLDPAAKYDAELHVKRDGLVLDAPIEFVKVQKALGSLDAKPFADATLVGKFGLVGSLDKLVIAMKDLSPVDAKVSTQYQIALSVAGKVIAQKTIDRASLPVLQGGVINLAVVKDLGVSAADAKLLKSGVTIKVDMKVVRSGPFSSGPSIEIPKSVTLTIQ